MATVAMRQTQHVNGGLPQIPPKPSLPLKMSALSSPGDDVTAEMRKPTQEEPKLKEGSLTQDDAQFTTFPFPVEFVVKYLGCRDAGGLWGIKHTRKPVDDMVSKAKQMKTGETLPFLKLLVSEKGVNIAEMPQNINKNYQGGFYPIDIISYGVQDLVYTRVFAMIVVREDVTAHKDAAHPFQCHAFVCDSRHSARRLTFALANAFQQFSKEVKGNKNKRPKKFAIDLRPADEIEEELKSFDSEA